MSGTGNRSSEKAELFGALYGAPTTPERLAQLTSRVDERVAERFDAYNSTERRIYETMFGEPPAEWDDGIEDDPFEEEYVSGDE